MNSSKLKQGFMTLWLVISILAIFLVTAGGIYLFFFYSPNQSSVNTTSSEEKIKEPALTSEPLRLKQKIDLKVEIINASNEDNSHLLYEKDLTDAGFTVLKAEKAEATRSATNIRFKKSKKKETELLIDWLKDDFKVIYEYSILKEASEADAILTIGCNRL